MSLRACLFLALALAVSPQTPATTPDSQYKEFMKLSATERTKAFQSAEPETKAVLKRIHAERWLTANSRRLSREQIDLVKEAIAVLTPALYESPPDPGVTKKSLDLQLKLQCALWRSDVIAAFQFDEDGKSGRFDDFMFWMKQC